MRECFVVTDNASEQIKIIDDGERFAFLSRSKGNSSNPDNIVVMNIVEANKATKWVRERLFARYNEGGLNECLITQS